MKKVQEVDFAYIAGLFDGEGSFIVAKHSPPISHNCKRGFVWELRMTIGMSDVEGLNLIKEISKKKRLRVMSTGKRKMYFLTLFSNEIRELLPCIFPYIRVKKKQARLLLEAVSIIKKRVDKDVDERLEQIYLEMKKLNHSRHLPK